MRAVREDLSQSSVLASVICWPSRLTWLAHMWLPYLPASSYSPVCMPPPASKFLPSVWTQLHRIGPHNDLILTWSSAKILFPDRIHRGWVCGPQHLLKDTVYSVTPPPFLILTAYIWKGNFTCQLKLVLVYEMSSCFLKNSSEWAPSSYWQREKELWGKHRDKTRYLLGREQLRGAFAREQRKEEIWITPCYRFLFPSIQTLLHTSLEQRLIYQNPINSTLDDGQWICFYYVTCEIGLCG